MVKQPRAVTITPAGPVPLVYMHDAAELISCSLDEQFTEAVQEELDSRDISEPVFRSGLLEPSVARLLELLMDEVEAGAPSGSLYAESLVHALIVRYLLSGRVGWERHTQVRSGMPLHILRRVKERIEAGLSEQVTLESLAQESGYSRAHFVKLFGNATGLTPHRYLLNRRIDRSKQLLLSTAMPLAEIATACGFSSQTHMTDAFRVHVGLSPAQYRRDRSYLSRRIALS